MPYYHKDCWGRVGIVRRKCNKCGKKWTWRVWFYPKPPSDLIAFYSIPEAKQGNTSYAKWGDKYPGVGFIASHMPNWPRPIRILSFVLFLGLVFYLVMWLVRSC